MPTTPHWELKPSLTLCYAPVDISWAIVAYDRTSAVLDSETYTAALRLFRSFTNQQDLMVEAAHSWAENLTQPYSFTSYGCGEGLFELSLITRLAQPVEEFVGVDSNKAGLRILRNSLLMREDVQNFRVCGENAHDYLAGSPARTSYGLAVQALGVLDETELQDTLSRMNQLHSSSFLAVEPLLPMNHWLKQELMREGLAHPVFAEQVQDALGQLAISYETHTLEAGLTLPKNIPTGDLSTVLSFLKRFPEPAQDRQALWNEVAKLGTVHESAEAVQVPHPVQIFIL